MSCIDAAIIKALVEHIGMDPEDVPVGSPHECVKYTAGEGIAISGDNVISATDSCNCVKYTAGEGINISGDNVISSTNACKCAAVADIPITNAQFGTVNKAGTDYLTISRINSSGEFITPGVVFITEEISSGKWHYHLCIKLAHSVSQVQILNTAGYGATDYTLSNYTITTPLNSTYHKPVGVFHINSLETLKQAFTLFMKWTINNVNSA